MRTPMTVAAMVQGSRTVRDARYRRAAVPGSRPRPTERRDARAISLRDSLVEQPVLSWPVDRALRARVPAAISGIARARRRRTRFSRPVDPRRPAAVG